MMLLKLFRVSNEHFKNCYSSSRSASVLLTICTKTSCRNILSCTRPAQRRVHSLHDKVHIRIFEFIWVVITLHLHLERMGFPGGHEKHKTMLSYQFIAPMLWRREQHHSLLYSTCSKSVASRQAGEPGGFQPTCFHILSF